MHDPFQTYGKLLSLARKHSRPKEMSVDLWIVYRVDLKDIVNIDHRLQFPLVHIGVGYMILIGGGNKSVSAGVYALPVIV
jgi:hypothetical protein